MLKVVLGLVSSRRNGEEEKMGGSHHQSILKNNPLLFEYQQEMEIKLAWEGRAPTEEALLEVRSLQMQRLAELRAKESGVSATKQKKPIIDPDTGAVHKGRLRLSFLL
jgi:hypothetical protein